MGHALEVERRGQGPPLVLLHRDLGPFGWSPLISELAPHFSVHAVSLPGFGGSPLPRWPRCVAHIAALVGKDLDRCRLESPPVVGLGFGGWVAAEIAAYSPQRVDRLVLVSPMGLKPDDGEIVDQFLYSARDYASLSVGGAERFAHLVEGIAPEVLDEQLDRSREAVTRVAWKPIGHDPALAGLLADTVVRAHVVWGADDAVVPPNTALRWAQVLGASTEVIAASPHHVELAEPALVAQIIRRFVHPEA